MAQGAIREVDKVQNMSVFFKSLLSETVSNEKNIIQKIVERKDNAINPLLLYVLGLSNTKPCNNDIVSFVTRKANHHNAGRLIDTLFLLGEDYYFAVQTLNDVFKEKSGVDHPIFAIVVGPNADTGLRQFVARENLKGGEKDISKTFVGNWLLCKSNEERVLTVTNLAGLELHWDAYCLFKLSGLNTDNDQLSLEIYEQIKEKVYHSLSDLVPDLVKYMINGIPKSHSDYLRMLFKDDISSCGMLAWERIITEFETVDKIDDYATKLESRMVLYSQVHYLILRAIVEEYSELLDKLTTPVAIGLLGKLNFFSDLQQLVFKSVISIVANSLQVLYGLSMAKVDPEGMPDNKSFVDTIYASWKASGVDADLLSELRRSSVLSFLKKLEMSIKTSGFDDLSLNPVEDSHDGLHGFVKAALFLSQHLVENYNPDFDSAAIYESFNTGVAKFSPRVADLFSSQRKSQDAPSTANISVLRDQSEPGEARDDRVPETAAISEGPNFPESEVVSSSSYEQTQSNKEDIKKLKELAAWNVSTAVPEFNVEEPVEKRGERRAPEVSGSEEEPTENRASSRNVQGSYSKEQLQMIGEKRHLTEGMKNVVLSGLPGCADKIFASSSESMEKEKVPKAAQRYATSADTMPSEHAVNQGLVERRVLEKDTGKDWRAANAPKLEVPNSPFSDDGWGEEHQAGGESWFARAPASELDQKKNYMGDVEVSFQSFNVISGSEPSAPFDALPKECSSPVSKEKSFNSGFGKVPSSSFGAFGGFGNSSISRGGAGGDGGYHRGRGSYNNDRGNYNDNGHRGRGNFDGGRGNFDGGRGNFDGGRGNFDGGRGAYRGNGGGFRGNGGGRGGGFRGARGNEQSSFGGF